MKKIKLRYFANSLNNNLEIARAFDIWYLFMESLGNILYVKWDIKNHPSKLNNKDFEKITFLNQILRNNLFSTADRYLLETYKQNKIEKIFNNILSDIDFDQVEKNPEVLKRILFMRKAWMDISSREKIDFYYKTILTRLKLTLNNLDFPEEIKNKIYLEIENSTNLEELLLYIYRNLAKTNNKIDIKSKEWLRALNWIVRELQAIENHKFILNNNKITNKLFFEIIDSRDYYELNSPKDIEKEDFFNLILDSHKEIDNLVDSFILEKEKYIEELKERYRSLDIKYNNNDFLFYIKIPNDLKSILHHLLDWYAKIAPWLVNKKETKKVAVIIYIIYEEVKNIFERSGMYTSHIDKEFLAKFWWWKWQSSISQLHYTHFGSFIEYFNWDISLMISNDLKLPKNWKKIWIDKGGFIEKYDQE